MMNTISQLRLIVYGLLTELFLVAVQLIYLNIYVSNNTGFEFTVSADYMMSRGFFIFQVIGFFVYFIAVYWLLTQLRERIVSKIITYVLAGSVVELSFYLFVTEGFQGAFLYSILDKYIAAVCAAIVYYFFVKGERRSV
jgi:hypothetical protein